MHTRVPGRLPAVLLLIALTAAPAAVAEVYRWVDGEGNVHFGDKPLDPAAAQKASPVAVDQAYKPEQRSPAGQEAYEREQRERWQGSVERADEQRRAQAEARAEQRAAMQEQCTAWRERIAGLTSMRTDAVGRRYYTYATEDGESVSSERQREIVAELRAKVADQCR